MSELYRPWHMQYAIWTLVPDRVALAVSFAINNWAAFCEFSIFERIEAANIQMNKFTYGGFMQINIQHPAFNLQHLSVETVGLFGEPKLLLNGSVLKGQQGFYRAVADTGNETTIGLIYNYFSRSAKLLIVDQTIDLPSQFNWYELDCPIH